MIVGMRTVNQAARVAALIGGVQLLGEPRKDGTVSPSRYVIQRWRSEPTPGSTMIFDASTPACATALASRSRA